MKLDGIKKIRASKDEKLYSIMMNYDVSDKEFIVECFMDNRHRTYAFTLSEFCIIQQEDKSKVSFFIHNDFLPNELKVKNERSFRYNESNIHIITHNNEIEAKISTLKTTSETTVNDLIKTLTEYGNIHTV